nr:hypothetical protein [Tanacetum cinerariifolium]
MISYTNRGKSLALPWRRTSRLDSDMRSGTLVGQGSAVIVTVDTDTLSQVTYSSGGYLFTSALLYLGRARLGFNFFFSKMGTVNSMKSVLTQSTLDEMDLFAFIYYADPTKDDGNDNVNEEGNDAMEAGHTEQGNHVFDVGGIDIVADDEIQAIVTDQSKKVRKKRLVADGIGGSVLPSKKLKEDYGNSRDASARVARKSLAAPKGTCRSWVELEYHFEECYKAVNDPLDWNNIKGHIYPFDLSKPLLLVEDQCRQVVHVDYFINNNLEYLKGGSSSRKYMTSTTKTKATKYVVWGITHWGPKRQRYGFASNMTSKHDVYSTKRINTVTHVKVMKWYDYVHLDEIKARREDQKLYKFKQGDFLRLNLHDIEDIRVVILKRVEDLQLGVESYQKKLNITRPETFRTLTSVITVLHDIASNLRMDNLPKRRWSNLDKKVSYIMIKVINQHLFEGEHQSDTCIFTLTMEILSDPTSNKLCGRSIHTNLTVIPTTRANDKAIFVPNFIANCLMHISVKMNMEVKSTQDGKRLQDDDQRICLVDDLKKLKITYKSSLKE